MIHRDRLRGLARQGHVLAGKLDAVARRFGLPAGVFDDGAGGVTWPRLPVHGQGTYRVRAVVLRLPAAQVASVLPPGMVLGSTGADDLHPVLLFFGRQTDVRPNISPLRGWYYNETVVGIPDVHAPGSRAAYQGPFAFMPRLWLDRLAPVLAGVFGYGYAKTLAHIHTTHDAYAVHAESGPLLAEARFSHAGAADRPHAFAAWPALQRLLDQPLLAEPVPGVEIGSVLSFRTQTIRHITPLRASVTLSGTAIEGLSGGAFTASGLADLPAAFEMESHWRITPPMPRSWFAPARRAARPAPPAPAPAPTAPPVAEWVKPRKRKIAILGGGVGSMTAAWALTGQPDWQDLYEITVYQAGWRLGGKGASGRNAALGQRIEEHGLHIWAGFYENAFRVMRDLYKELGRPAGSPLATIEDAFKPHALVTLEDQSSGAWESWTTLTPPAPGLPGEGDPLLPRHPLHYLSRLFEGLAQVLPYAGADVRGAMAAHPVRARATVRASVAAAGAGGAPAASGTVLGDLHAVGAHATRPGPHRAGQLLSALRLIRAIQATPALAEAQAGADGVEKQAAHLLDLGLATARGMITDGLIFRGFAAADGVEWTDWLRRHGARPATLESPVVRSTYDYVFGFAAGDTGRRALAAGTTTHGLLRLMLTYRGSFFWAMQAGMGDTVFGPFYSVLRARGVRFEFFHRVEHLGLSDDRMEIDRIDIAVQARPVGGTYAPFVKVADLDCWPSQPLFDQLRDGATLRESGADLEHENGPLAVPRALRRGADFDAVVLGISLGALPAICADLVAAAPRWRTMLDKVRTVATLGVQLWFDGDLPALGWTGGQTLATAYAEPLDTWADMAWLLPRETWAGPKRPGSVIYLCGPLADAAGGGDTATEQRIARDIARDWLARNAGHLWPAVSGADGALDLASLFAPDGGTPEQRFAAQYFRANTRNSERYVQTVPGATEARLRPSESGFNNLVLAGDWVRSGMNAGCVEAAAMGGLAAAASVSHRTIDIIDGEDIPLAGSLLETAIGALHGVARTEAVVVLASLPVADARALLPEGLELGSQILTPDGAAPVVIILSRHRDARLNVLPFGVCFRELTLMLPSTRPTGIGARYALPGPFAYVARQVLDSPSMASIGRALYGDVGQLGRFATGADGATHVRTLGGSDLLALTATQAGETVAAASFRHSSIVDWVLGRPLLSRNHIGGGWRLSRLDYGLEQARVQAISITLNTYPGLRLGSHPSRGRLASGQAGVIGAFRIWCETTRSNPMLGQRRRPD